MDLPEHITPEKLEQIRTLFEQMGASVDPADRSIKRLCQTHQELCDSLRGFALDPVVRIVASMETVPGLHANTIRIEILLHLAVCSCKGTKQPTTPDLRKWAALLENSPMSTQEDPPEDVFVSYICTPDGGFRVYPGIFSNAEFILERLLLFLGEKTNFPGFRDAYESVLELLKVSEAVGEDLGLLRYSGCNSLPGDSIQVPDEAEINKHSEAIVFGEERLSRQNIDLVRLKPFLFKQDAGNDFALNPLFGSPLEHQPLFALDGGFLVASPSCLCRAAVAHILGVTPRLGGWADTFFEKENAEFFVNEVVRRLEVRALGGIKLPDAPESIPLLYPYVGQFDHGRAVLSFIVSSPISTGTDLEEVESFTDNQVADFTKYVGECCAAIESIDGFCAGLILMAIAGVGRPVAFGVGDLRPNWRFFSSGLADWHTLAADRGFNAKRLWYLGLQQEFAEVANIHFINTAGLLNLYAFWKQNDFSLIPKEINPKHPRNTVWIGENFAQTLNIQLKATNDRHCCPSPDGKGWILLQREGPGLNPDLNTNLRYCDYEAAREGRLRGCVEHQAFAWWLEADIKPANPDSSNLLYRMWNCVFNWLERALPVLSSKHPNWIPRSIEFVLDFPGVDGWDLQSAIQPGEKLEPLDWNTDKEAAVVRLVFVESFLQKFYRPDNLAEREIVAAVLRTTAEVAGGTPSDSDIHECVENVVKDEGTRFFHVVKSPTLESALGGPENAEPALIPFEEIARVHLGLAYEVDANPPQSITDTKQAKSFLDKTVAFLQDRVCSRLRELELMSIVSYSFVQLDELSRDKYRWSLSTRALLSLEENADWLRDRLRTEKARITIAEIANRALIETAVYSHNPKATEIISQTEHGSLLAEFAVMIELANHRDSIAYGFVPADLTIQPNGTLDYDDSFQEEVLQPYLKSRMDDKIEWDADAYDSYFGQPEAQEKPRDEAPAEVVAFQRAFSDEFGFAYSVLDKVIEHFDELAVTQGRFGGSLSCQEIRWMLKEEVGLSDPQTKSFLEHFILPIRPSWKKELPLGCDHNDVLPWRYYRGLSVLVRPFVEVSRSPRQFAISAPHLHRWVRYLTHSISEGTLPAKLFQSVGMKSYLGSIADKKGHQFTEETANRVQEMLPDQRVEIKMTELGAPADPDLGDVDVFAWDQNSGLVLLIECKHLKTALTVRQVIQQLENFRGDTEDKDDALGKHQRRVEWLKANPNKLSQLTGIHPSNIRWLPLLVTSGRVPMSFVDAINFPREQVVPEKELETRMSSILENLD